jgi:outer membrane protein assembly factor BamA
MFSRLILLAALLVPIQAQESAFRLESVTLTGTTLRTDIVVEMAGLHVGAPIDKNAIEAACGRLRDTGLFQSINYHYAPGAAGGYALNLIVEEHTHLTDAAIDIPTVDEGAVWLWLSDQFPAFNRKVPGNDAAQQFIANRIEKHLGSQLEGRHVVSRIEAELLPPRRTLVSFQPETLPLVGSMSFNGQHEIPSEELERLMRKVFTDRGYTDRSFREAVELNLRRAYEDHGMYRVRFPGIVSKKESASKVAVTTTIEEGPKFTLGEVELVGENLPVGAMLKAGNFKKLETANWSEIQQGIWDLEKPLKRTGSFRATAQPERILHDDPPVLDVRIRFERGPFYRFGQLKVNGLPPNLEASVRKEWKLQPGDPFDYDYPHDFLREFAHSVDSQKIKKFTVSMADGAGEHVMDFILTCETR